MFVFVATLVWQGSARAQPRVRDSRSDGGECGMSKVVCGECDVSNVV